MIGYGRCMSATTRLTTGRLVSGTRLLSEAVIRRLTTPRGSIWGDEDYGFDIAGYVGAVGVGIAVAALPSILESEVLKDDRIESCAVIATRDDDEITIKLRMRSASSSGDFALTLAVGDVGVSVLGGLS